MEPPTLLAVSFLSRVFNHAGFADNGDLYLTRVLQVGFYFVGDALDRKTIGYTMYLLLNMQTKIAKWGNSFAVRIPGKIVDRLALREGENLAVDVVGDAIKLAPFKKRIPRYSLKELLKGMKPFRLSREDRIWLDSPPVGKERI